VGLRSGIAERTRQALGSVLLSLCPCCCLAQAQQAELVAQLGHTGVNDAVFSPDGRILVTGGTDNSVKLWDAASGQELHTLAGMRGGSYTALSSDGKLLATGSNDKTVRLWDMATRKPIRTMDSGDIILSLAFSPNNKSLAVASGKTVQLWSVPDGQMIGSLEGHTSMVDSVAFSPDGRMLVSGGTSDLSVKVWDLRSRTAIQTLKGHKGFVENVFFTSDGRHIFSNSDSDQSYKIWDLDRGTASQPVTDRDLERTPSAVLSPDGTVAATAELRKGSCETRIRDALTGRQRQILLGSADCPRLAFSQDGKVVAGMIRYPSPGQDPIRLWDVATGQESPRPVGLSEETTAVAFSPDGSLLARASNDHTVKIWSLHGRTEVATLAGHSRQVENVAFSPDSKLLASVGLDGIAVVWEVSSGKEFRKFAFQPAYSDNIIGGPLAAAFSPDGKILAVGSDNDDVQFWDLAADRKIDTIGTSPGLGRMVSGLAYTPDGRMLIEGSGRSPIQVWDMRTKQQIATPTQQQPGVIFALSPDGSTAASSDGRSIEVLSLSSDHGVRVVSEHPTQGDIPALALSSDNRTLVTADAKGRIRIRDISNWTERELGSTPDSIHTLTFHPAGNILASAGQGPRIRLWDVRGGRELCSVFSFPDGTWAVVDGVGRYDASNAGRIKWLHWVVNNEVIALDQLKERYYEPGLLAKLMGANREPLRDVTTFAAVELYPEVGVTAPKPNDPKLGIHLRDRGGGIGKVVVTINGKEIASDARAGVLAQGSQMDLTVDLSRQPFLKPGENNVVEVKAFDREGNLSSKGFAVPYRPAGTTPSGRLEFWAIIAGISDYAGPDLHLQYAAKDAEDMALALRIGAEQLFGREQTHIIVLTTTGNPGTTLPTRANLQRAFEAARRAKPRDVLVVYLSGHGVTYGGPDGDYYYLTQGATTGDLTDPAVRSATAISSAQLGL
jgi:WD40 repeat protein